MGGAQISQKSSARKGLTERICFDKAKSKELASWKEHDVFEEVNFTGQKCVSTRWICTLKNTADGLVPKARLVARGFEEEGLQEIPKDSPTCLKESLRMNIIYKVLY